MQILHVDNVHVHLDKFVNMNISMCIDTNVWICQPVFTLIDTLDLGVISSVDYFLFLQSLSVISTNGLYVFRIRLRIKNINTPESNF